MFRNKQINNKNKGFALSGNRQAGFTLVELLVAVAIIGILSAIVLISLGGARAKARLGRVQSQMKSLHPYLVMCMNDERNLTSGTPNRNGGTVICSGSSGIFPALPSNWNYGGNTTSYLNPAYRATGEGKTVTCRETGCITS